MEVGKYGRKHFAVYDDTRALLAVTCYKKGAEAVADVIEGLQRENLALRLDKEALERQLAEANARGRQLTLFPAAS